MRLFASLLIAGLVSACMASDGGAVSVAFAPHRALYELALVPERSAHEVREASGELAVEWRDSCDGWTFQYRSLIEIGYAEGKPVRLHTSATTWEAADGRDFRFSVRHETNGTVTERVEGRATLDEDGAGAVAYRLPEPKRVDLPEGTLFPVAHSRDLLRAARRGPPPVFHARTVFDGMDAEGAYRVSAAIGRGTSARTGFEPLRGRQSWPVHIAYFQDSPAPAPRFEMAMRLFANGISDDLVMALEDLTLHGRIHKLELLPADCPE